MNTTKTVQVRLFALAAAGLALAGAATAAHAADPRPVIAPNGWGSTLGPGVGSVKTPFLSIPVGHSFSSTTDSGMTDDTLLFHTTTGQAAQTENVRPLGPGPWSVKSPGSGSY